MLARQQRRRHDDRHLLAVHRGDEGGAQRHLRLAEADIAAHQAVHRPAAARSSSTASIAPLVLGLVVGKAGGEFVVDPLRRGQHRRGAHRALGRDLDEFARHLAHALLQPGLARLPADAAELVECARLFRAVARQQLDILDRQEQLVAAGILDFEAIVRRARRLDRLQAHESADAVLDVDDEIASGQRRHFGDEIGLRRAPPLRPHEPIAENVLLADDGEAPARTRLSSRRTASQTASGVERLGRAQRATGSSGLSPCSASTWLSRSREPSVQPATITLCRPSAAPAMCRPGVEHVDVSVLPLRWRNCARPHAAAIDACPPRLRRRA